MQERAVEPDLHAATELIARGCEAGDSNGPGLTAGSEGDLGCFEVRNAAGTHVLDVVHAFTLDDALVRLRADSSDPSAVHVVVAGTIRRVCLAGQR